MAELPQNIADLHLAPVALKVDRRLADLAALTDEELAHRVALESDEPDWSPALRKDALLRSVGHLIDLQGWLLSWDARGIRLSNQKNSLVLGVPPNCLRFIGH